MRDPMIPVLSTFRDPATSGWKDAWAGLEPTFQTKRSIRKWRKAAARGEAGEDAYFKSEYMLETQLEVARAIAHRYVKRQRKGDDACMFAEVDLEEELDQWKITRQNLHFRWDDKDLPDFECKLSLDPETFEWSIKPVPVAWLYDARFVRFLEKFIWGAPLVHGLSASMAHGGGQFSLSAKTFMSGSLLCDDLATRLNHPELCTWFMDWPNCDDRAFRATRTRYEAFKRVIDQYWAGGFHPATRGGYFAENAILDRGFDPHPSPAPGLMDRRNGPSGSARDVFQTNFAFGRWARLRAQAIHPGYWQAQSYQADGYRPDQIMRYSEANVNRMQVAGERHVKSGKVLDADRVPELYAPLDPSMLYTEASFENRGQMGKTSARDFVEALLLDVHYAQWLQRNPGVVVQETCAQDLLLMDGEATVLAHAGRSALDQLHHEARAANLEASAGAVHSDWIEPETLFWAAWQVLPQGERARVAHEAIANFVARVENAATSDTRSEFRADPMEWHRHRIHPALRKALAGASLPASDPVARELAAYDAKSKEYDDRRPQFSQAKDAAPWE